MQGRAAQSATEAKADEGFNWGGIFGGNSAPSTSSKPVGRRSDSILDTVVKTTARTIGSELGRQIIRGVLGSLLGKRK